MPKYNHAIRYRREGISQLVNKIWEYPLSVVEAPMGYGKTTAVEEYLKKCDDATVLWQTLSDDSVNSFWHGFTRLFKKIDIICGEGLAELGVPDNSIFMAEAIELIGRVTFLSRTVIVIDDYHLLSSESIDRFIEFLVKTAHFNLHIVIISRVMFGENTTELALKGYCYIIDKSYFEFTQSEIVAYYKLCGINLKPQEVVALYTYTEGWVSALYLCMLSLLQEGRIECQASLHELIEKVVYRYCPTEVKEFLLHICIFDSFTLEQAKAVWHKENSEGILSRLIAKNAFIKYDKVNKRYQMHNIFTSYLRVILGKQEVKKQQAILLAAGEWYVSVRDYIHAMDYFHKAADFDKLLTAIELDKGNSTNNEHKERFIKYFKDCPVEIKKKYPIAGLLYARKLFTFNETVLFAAQCAEMATYIDNIHEEQTKKQLSGELELICSFTKYNDIRGMSGHHKKAYELLKGPSRLFDNNAAWTFGSPSILYMFYRKSGELEQEVSELLEAMPYYYHIAVNRGYGAEYVMQAECFYHRGDFEKAEIIINKALYMAQSHRQIGIIICGIFLQMRLAFVKGELSSVMNLLQQMRAEIKKNGQYLYVHTADMCEGFIYSCLHQEKKIPVWIVAGYLQESRLSFPSHGFFNIVYGKALLLSGEYLKLIGIAEAFIGIANVFPNLLGNVYTHIYVAAAQYRLQHYSETQLALKKAIDIAAPDQLIMPFIENGEYVINGLIELEKDEQYAEFIGNVRKGYVSFAKQLKAMKDEPESSKRPFITAREREIAELVANGLSNHVIAETLYIAEVTVKKALQNIYAKLGISSRSALTKIMIEEKMG